MTGRHFYTWQVRSCSIRISLDIVDRLNRCLSDPRLNAAEEQGGILYGTIRGDVTEITNFEFFRSEHRRGVAYDLGARERAQVARIVAARIRRSSDRPVGYFRTHLRQGLFLDQDDFAVMCEAFERAESVALAIRTEPNGTRRAGFFFWEDGDMNRHRAELTFAFDADALAPEAMPLHQPVAKKQLKFPVVAPRWVLAAAAVPAIAAAVALHIPARSKPVASAAPISLMAIARPAIEPVSAPITAVLKKQASVEKEAPLISNAISAPAPVYAALPEPVERPVEITQPAQLTRSVEVAKVTSTPMAEPPAERPREEPRSETRVSVAVSLEARAIRNGKGSDLRRAVGHVPLLGHAFRKNDADAEFTPARPGRALTPKVPARFAQDLTDDFSVDVRVSIDNRGGVTSAEVLNGAGGSLATLAAETASATEWKPALLGDKEVPSEVILHYRFRPVRQEISRASAGRP